MSNDVTFPLPRYYFPPMDLTEKEERKYEAWGESLVQETIDAYHRDQFMTPEQKDGKWKVLKQRGDLVAFRRRDTSNEHNSRYLLTGTVNGTLDEILFGRYADNTDDYRRVSSIYRDDLVDCAIVHVIKKRTPENPFYFSGFKWMTVQSPGKGLVKNRDVCWYEQTGFTMDHHGKEIGYSIAESVELPTCPPFQKCVRARVSICFLYRQTKNGTLKVYMRGKNRAGGRVIDWVTDLKSAELWLRVEELITCAHAKIASDLVACTEANMNGVSARCQNTSGRCDVCRKKKTGVFASLTDCSVCKRGACSRCCVKKRVLGSENNFKQVHKEVFCKKCVQLIHDAPLRDLNAIEDLHSLALGRVSNESSFSSSILSQCSILSLTCPSTAGSSRSSARVRSPRAGCLGSAEQQLCSQRSGHHSNSRPHQNQSNSRRLPVAPTNTSSSSCPAPVPLVLYEVEPVMKASRSLDEIHQGYLGNFSSKNTDCSIYSSSAAMMTSELSYNENSFANSHITTPEVPVEVGIKSNVSPSSSGSPGISYVDSTQPEFSYSPSVDYTPENIMTKMIKMNIMAERARKLVQENDRLARIVSQGSN